MNRGNDAVRGKTHVEGESPMEPTVAIVARLCLVVQHGTKQHTYHEQVHIAPNLTQTNKITTLLLLLPKLPLLRQTIITIIGSSNVQFC